jgi:3-deoxy-7-phosphoheptulonate synthase
MYLVTSAKESLNESFKKKFKDVTSLIDTKTEYQLSSRKFKKRKTQIFLNKEIVFGKNKTVMMAGPCAIESESQVMKTASFLSERMGVKVFRAGAFKPRTSFYTFQGLGVKGLKLLEKVRNEFGMKIITEVKDTTHLDVVAEVADIVQIGTKSMYNFSLLERCGKINKPVLLKRGFMATVKEFLQAADFIIANGNPQVILCERGIRSFEPSTRFTLDLGCAALIQGISHLPVVIDPSHAVGVASLVGKAAQASAGLGVDGLLVEVHPNPVNSKSDKDQALTFQQFEQLYSSVKRISKAVDRVLI